VVNVRNREEVAQGLDSPGSAHIDAVNALASPILNNAAEPNASSRDT
jgi:hypothetical protein